MPATLSREEKQPNEEVQVLHWMFFRCLADAQGWGGKLTLVPLETGSMDIGLEQCRLNLLSLTLGNRLPGLAGRIVLTGVSRSETWVPKRGGLKPAGRRQESATFLQRSFFNVAVQFFARCSAAFGQNDFRTTEKPMLQCNFCSAAFQKLQRNFRFRLWHVAGVGFRGGGV